MSVTEYNDIGHYLRDSRQSVRLTVEQVAEAMHIRPRYVQAIEAGQFETLPGKAYVRGYLRNYALLLGVDPTPVLEAYDTLTPTQPQEFFIPEPTRSENLPSRALMWLLVVGAVLGLGYMKWTSHRASVAQHVVPEVPAELVWEAFSTRDPHLKKWKNCLRFYGDACFIHLHNTYSNAIPSSVGHWREHIKESLSDKD